MNIDMTIRSQAPQPTTFGELAGILNARPQAPAPEPPAPEPKPTPGVAEGIKAAIERANADAARRSVDLRFGIHEASGNFYVRVLDPKTNEVIKTVPPEQLLDFRAALERSIGILFDEVA
ncbi:MAG: flagellar protein [Planctomycetota bacterium]|nr:MAG: flagellar protein [Planctomycetota bacterium]